MANGTSVAGTWTYRSYINTSDQPLFGVGLFTFQTPTATTLTGTFDMGSDLVLDLKGTLTPANGDSPLIVDIRGLVNTGTDGWEYDYHGFDAFHWPAGVDQVQSLVGSVLRAKPHDGGPAGVTAAGKGLIDMTSKAKASQAGRQYRASPIDHSS